MTNATCSVSEGPHSTGRLRRGMCARHYRLFMKTGDPLSPSRYTRRSDQLEWLKAKSVMDTDECVEWPWSRSKGYGQLVLDGVNTGAHRVALILRDGDPGRDLVTRHRCHNPACVNTRHLEWGSQGENIRDRERDGTVNVGEVNGIAKLTADQAREIYRRAWDGENHYDIAADYPIIRAQVSSIKHGATWSTETGHQKKTYNRPPRTKEQLEALQEIFT